jgi:LPS-assembly protein
VNWYTGAPMTTGRAVRLVIAAGLLATRLPAAADPVPVEVRVSSGPGTPTVVTLQATPEATIEDRTPGAHPAPDATGPASVGETFSDEIRFVVRGVTIGRQGEVDVGDALVSAVRLFPDPAGAQVVVFVRQPVSYAIARPTGAGAIAVTLRPRTVVAPSSVSAQPGRRHPPTPRPQTGKDEVAVDAAELQYEQEANVLIAHGGVTLTRGATTLQADEVRYDRTNAVAEAHGHVVIVDPEATVEGDSARLDLNDETGWVDQVEAEMKQSPYRLEATHLEKRGGPCYGIVNGVFTTCRCGGLEKPPWSIKAAETDVTLGGVGVSRDTTFRVSDVPILYSPYFLFPANTERSTGFLMPNVGYSNRRGFILDLPFYWAIDKSQDATVVFDLETAARVGVIGEYRYEWSKQARGLFTFGYFNEGIGGTPETLQPISPAQAAQTTPEDRWIVAGRHSQPFLYDSQLYLDVLRISDVNFLREIRAFTSTVRGDINVRSTRLTRSQLETVKTWDGGGLLVGATAYQDLIDAQELTLDAVPKIAAEHSLPLVNGLAVGRLHGEAIDYQRTEGYDGTRFDLGPDLLVPFHGGRWLYGSLRGQFRETAYYLTNEEQVGRFVPNDTNFAPTFALAKNTLPNLATTESRELGTAQGRLASEVARVYDFPFFGLEKIRHSIEPEVQYLFVPPTQRHSSEVPAVVDGRPGTLFAEGYLFDEIDAINRRNFVSYGLTSRILGRGPAATASAAAPAPGTAPAGSAGGAAPAESVAAPGATVPVDTDVDDDENEDEFEEIDQDTLAQGLPAKALPTFAGKPAAPAAGGPVVPTSRELLRASILHGYDISRQLAGDHMSDVDVDLHLTPVDYAGLSYGSTIDVEKGRALATSVGFVLREPWWQPPAGRARFQSPTTLAIAYRDISNAVNQGFPPNSPEARLFNAGVQNIDGALYLRVTDYLGFLLLARYDLSTTQAPEVNHPDRLHTLGPHFLERDFYVRLMSQCDCWLLEAGVSDRSDTNDTTFRVQFTLFGLGSIGQGPRGNSGWAALSGLQTIGYRRPWGSAAGGGYGGSGY